MARSLICNWSKFETIFVATLLIDIFSITSPVSKYLQTKSIGYLQAWSMINKIKNQIKKLKNYIHMLFLFKTCQTFARNINYYFLNKHLIEIEEDFPHKRVYKKKMSGEKCKDESRNLSPYDKFKSDAFSIFEMEYLHLHFNFRIHKMHPF